MKETKNELEIKYITLVANWSKGFQTSLKHVLTAQQFKSVEEARLSEDYDVELHAKPIALEILGYINR